jgi:hypothetical protein
MAVGQVSRHRRVALLLGSYRTASSQQVPLHAVGAHERREAAMAVGRQAAIAESRCSWAPTEPRAASRSHCML